MPLNCLEPKPCRNLKIALPSIPSLPECLIQPISWTGLYLRGSEEDIGVFNLHFIYTVTVWLPDWFQCAFRTLENSLLNEAPFGCLLLKELGLSLLPASRALQAQSYVCKSAFPSVILFGALLTLLKKFSMHLYRKRGNITL